MADNESPLRTVIQKSINTKPSGNLLSYYYISYYFKYPEEKFKKQVRAMSTNSLFLPHKVIYHIEVAFSSHYVIHIALKKKGLRRQSPRTPKNYFSV